MKSACYLLVLVQLATSTPVSKPPYSVSPESYGVGSRDDMVDWSAHPCRRQCKLGAEPMDCRYGFTVEHYTSMSKACYDCPRNRTDCFRPHCIPADGLEKSVYAVNRQLPGPSIEVCLGDRIIVDLTNGLASDTTTIHWHGITQRGSPYMDGVPYITQCPIMPGDAFRYDFVPEDAGSFMWHSHSGEQRADGLFGALVVRAPPEHSPTIRQLYDHDEHVLVLNEWTQIPGDVDYSILYHNNHFYFPQTILVNGLGSNGIRQRDDEEEQPPVPAPVFEVEKGKRYRFRLVNVGSQDCPIRVEIQGHAMLVVSADGADVEPVEVDSIRMLTGERYDFVLSANQEVGNYVMRFNGDSTCQIHKCHQIAVLRYRGAPEVEPVERKPAGNNSVGSRHRILNPFDQGTETPGAICIPTLNTVEPDDVELMGKPDHQFYISFSYEALDNYNFHRRGLYGYHQVKKDKRIKTIQLNHISNKMTNFPLLSQPELIEPDQFCNSSTTASWNCTTEHCVCSHVLNARLGDIVELIMVDLGNNDAKSNHPMHLHGTYHRVLAMEKLSNGTITLEDVRRLDSEGKIHRKLKGMPLKDTVTVPKGGYTIIRFRADNPGYWFFHCHFDKHANSGMGLTIKVGEHKDFPKVPENFPKCGGHRTF